MNSCAPFVRKTFQLVSDSATNSIVSWSNNGTTFTVWNTQAFQKQILPQYFKHNNLCSFVRQLNTYGFHKVNAPETVDGLEFSHQFFKQGSKNLLSNVTRRKTKSTKTEKESTKLSALVSDNKVAEALISLVKRQQESEQLLMSVCKELQEARSVIDSLRAYDASSPSSPSSPSVCGKRSYQESYGYETIPAPKKAKLEFANDLFNLPAQEMISFDNIFEPTPSYTCASTARDIDLMPSDFDIKELLLDF